MAVRTESGDLVRFPTADIVAGKTVPPRAAPLRDLDPEEADRRAQPGWPPVEQADLGQWLLRASDGFSNRGNSVLALGDPGLPLAEALRQVAGWYDARGLPPRAHALPGSPAADAFEEAGWDRYDAHGADARSARPHAAAHPAGAGAGAAATWCSTRDGWPPTSEPPGTVRPRARSSRAARSPSPPCVRRTQR